MTTGFEKYPTVLLEAVRDNLARGMEYVLAMTPEERNRPVPKGAPAREMAGVSKMIFEQVQKELDSRVER